MRARGGPIKGTTQQGRREAPGPGLPLLLHENSICATVAAVNALFHTELGGREGRAGYRVRRRERDGARDVVRVYALSWGGIQPASLHCAASIPAGGHLEVLEGRAGLQLGN